MRQVIRTTGWVAIIVFVAMLKPAAAQTVKAEMLKDWSNLKGLMSKLAAEMPADKFDFKPTPAQQSFGERVVHVATANVRFLGTADAKATAPTIDPKTMGKDAVIKALEASFDYGTAILNEQTDQTMVGIIKAPFIGESTRARLYTFLMGHTWDIYGQLVVYLRLSGGVPPASQRP